MIYFTSDHHFNHNNVIGFDNRPFDSIEEMNETLVERHNQRVKKGDLVYILGDLFWRDSETFKIDTVLNRMNGSFFIVKGNHDYWLKKHKNHRKIAGIDKLKEIVVKHDGNNYYIVMCHYAMCTWNKAFHGAFHLFGHSHDNLKNPVGKSMDVGVVTNNYYPYSLPEIIDILSKKEFQQLDHHGE